MGYTIETIAIEAAAPYLPELKSVLPEAASAALDALPAGPTLSKWSSRRSKSGLMWLIRKLKEAEQHKEGSWQRRLEGNVPRDPRQQRAEGHSEPGLNRNPSRRSSKPSRWLEDLLPFYDELAKVTALPWKEFDARYPEFVKKAKAANPLADQVLPIDGSIVATERRNQTQMALFKAAIAVVQGGPDRLKDIKDPFGDGPFEYRALDKGFELKSKLTLSATSP